MKVYVLRAPARSLIDRPLYYVRSDESGRVALSHHQIMARRFDSWALAVDFAAARAPTLDDFVAVRSD